VLLQASATVYLMSLYLLGHSDSDRGAIDALLATAYDAAAHSPAEFPLQPNPGLVNLMLQEVCLYLNIQICYQRLGMLQASKASDLTFKNLLMLVKGYILQAAF
jgi:hypothetical protein